MDLFIETLTGTAFELRVSPFETIMSVKAKIQRLEGERNHKLAIIVRGNRNDGFDEKSKSLFRLIAVYRSLLLRYKKSSFYMYVFPKVCPHINYK